MIQELRIASEQSDTRAIEYFQKAQEYLSDSGFNSELEELESSINAYDFEGALKT